MADDFLQPSPEAEAVLRRSGWSPEREVDISEWVERLRSDGNDVFPLAEAILRNFGSMRLEHRGFGGLSRYDFEVNPRYWYDERDRLLDIEEIVGSRACPLGETSGAAMLAVLADGRVIVEFEGNIVLIERNWTSALDHLLFGRGESIRLAEDYVPVEPPG